MTYNEETFVLDTLQELREFIRSPAYKQLCKETHENNLMLKELIKVERIRLSSARRENDDDFARNVLANIISNPKQFNYGK